MTRQYFGTDGVRGIANAEPMTASTVLRLAMAAASHFRRGSHRHSVVIGKDTRLSGYMLEPALVAGFTSMGMDVLLVGPLPTPAISLLTRSMRCDLGVMISASHNPYQDNGIKLFGPDGYKLSDDTELEIESRMQSPFTDLPQGKMLGRAKRIDDAAGRYIEFVKASFPRHLRLDGLKIVIDCAHGAAYRVAPTILDELGATIIPIGITPNGTNINETCGATHPATMQEAVRLHQADLGIALDGDADRVIMADETGKILDGDTLLGLIARHLQQQNALHGGAVVSTIMSNLALENWLMAQGIALHRTPVGDRYVVEKMRESGCNLGGEQSGHIILGDRSATGDGLMAALQILAVLSESGQKLSELCQIFTPYPQILRNIRYESGNPLSDSRVISAKIAAESLLGKTGRMVLRKSGTEPLIRIMAEGENLAKVEESVQMVAEMVTLASVDGDSAVFMGESPPV